MPNLIRESAHRLESYSPEIGADLSEVTFTDYGNLNLGHQRIEENCRTAADACKAIINTRAIPILLARDSRYTAAAVRATAELHPELTVLQLGARPNLLETYENSKWHARTAMKRVCDHLPYDQIKHFGVRCGTKAEFNLMTKGKPPVTRSDLATLGKKGLYLSFHLSLFAPSTAPGVTDPEPGGISYREFTKILPLIPWERVKACDLVGLQPSGDHTGLSHLVAAKATREIILSLAKRPATRG